MTASVQDIAIRQAAPLAAGGASPLPVFSGPQMTAALVAYQELQHALDKAMPDQIMDLDGKKFRKKGYWRAVAVAFNISVETLEERREVAGHFRDGRENFGYVVTRRAVAPNGRSVVSDGTCFAVEKARRFKCPHPEREGSRRTLHFPHSSCPDFDPEFQWRVLPGDATEHNVRGHATTRAFNRAVSDLVGFGEVSAEEIEQDDHQGAQAPATARQAGHGRTQGADSQGAPAASQAAHGQPVAQLADGVTTVRDVTVKKGKSAKGEWTRYYVTFADGRDGVTFSGTLGEQLLAAKGTPEPFNPVLEKGDKGTDLKGLGPVAVSSAAPPEPQHPDEPVEGPEKVLTVRRVDTDNGQRWVIQTGKRTLVTDQEAHATAAVDARKDGLGVVPSFETLRSASGATANRLLSLVVEVPADREPGAEG